MGPRRGRLEQGDLRRPPARGRHFKKASGGRWYRGPAVVFHQRVDEDLGCASYLIGDETSGEAVVVDPAYAIEPYLEEAERRGVRIVRVLETHTHADHLSGHGRLALEHGLPVTIHPLAEPEYPFDPVEDGDELLVGAIAIRVIHTPGHRPEHCLLPRGRPPCLTGDSLFDRRRGPSRPRGRPARGCGEPLRIASAPGRAPREHRGRPRPRRGLALRDRDQLGALIDDRLRAPVEPRALATTTCRSSSPRRRRCPRRARLRPSSWSSSTAGRSWAPLPRSRSSRPSRVRCSTSARPLEFAAGHVHGALSVPVSGPSFGTKAGFLLDAEQPVVDRRLVTGGGGRRRQGPARGRASSTSPAS